MSSLTLKSTVGRAAGNSRIVLRTANGVTAVFNTPNEVNDEGLIEFTRLAFGAVKAVLGESEMNRLAASFSAELDKRKAGGKKRSDA